MGRNCGYLALAAGIAGGAEAIVMPEVETEPEVVVDLFRDAYHRGKAHAIGVVAEGARYNAHTLADYCNAHQERLGFDLRVITLGHVQRGGAPGAFDRLLATRFGVTAVECLHQEVQGVLKTVSLSRCEPRTRFEARSEDKITAWAARPRDLSREHLALKARQIGERSRPQI